MSKGIFQILGLDEPVVDNPEHMKPPENSMNADSGFIMGRNKDELDIILDEIIAETGELEVACEAYDTIEEVYSLVTESYESGGMTPRESRIVETTLRHFVGRNYDRRLNLETESFQELRTRTQASKLTMEGIGDLLEKGLNAIIELIKKVIKGIRELFSKIFSFLFGGSSSSGGGSGERIKSKLETAKAKVEEYIENRKTHAGDPNGFNELFKEFNEDHDLSFTLSLVTPGAKDKVDSMLTTLTSIALLVTADANNIASAVDEPKRYFMKKDEKLHPVKKEGIWYPRGSLSLLVEEIERSFPKLDKAIELSVLDTKDYENAKASIPDGLVDIAVTSSRYGGKAVFFPIGFLELGSWYIVAVSDAESAYVIQDLIVRKSSLRLGEEIKTETDLKKAITNLIPIAERVIKDQVKTVDLIKRNTKRLLELETVITSEEKIDKLKESLKATDQEGVYAGFTEKLSVRDLLKTFAKHLNVLGLIAKTSAKILRELESNSDDFNVLIGKMNEHSATQ